MTPSPRHVLHVLNGAGGGAALSTLALIGELARRGTHSSAVCHDAGERDERDALREACDGRVIFTPLYLWNKKVRAARWKRPVLEARQLARTGCAIASTARVIGAGHRFGATLVHSNTSLTIEGGVAARRLAVPHVWHVRELIGEDAPFQFPLRGAALGRYLKGHASMIVANSASTAGRLANFLPADQLVVVQNGVDLEPLRSVTHPPLANRPLVVGMVANLTSRWKKHALFLEAMSTLPPTISATIALYGAGAPPNPAAPPSDSYVASLLEAARGLTASREVEFRGFAPTAQAMAALDVLVHPADNESFGRIVVEAWAAGVAVVGVDGAGVGELVQHERTGLLARPNDAAALAAATARILSERCLRERLVVAGRAEAERFSARAHGDAMIAVYREGERRHRVDAARGPAVEVRQTRKVT